MNDSGAKRLRAKSKNPEQFDVVFNRVTSAGERPLKMLAGYL